MSQYFGKKQKRVNILVKKYKKVDILVKKIWVDILLQKTKVFIKTKQNYIHSRIFKSDKPIKNLKNNIDQILKNKILDKLVMHNCMVGDRRQR